MHQEINAGVEHLAALAVKASASFVPWTAHTRNLFVNTLKHALRQRYSGLWHPEEPERGSAARALHWAPEERTFDEAVLRALHCCAPTVDPVRHLPLRLTVWIDPGCVSVRSEHASRPPASGTTQVIWRASMTSTARKLSPLALDFPRPAFTPEYKTSPLPLVQPLPSGSDVLANTPSSGFSTLSHSSSLLSHSLPSLGHFSSASSGFSSSASSSDDEEGGRKSLCGDSEISADDERDLIDCANSLGLLNFLGDDSTEQQNAEQGHAGDETVMPVDVAATPNRNAFRFPSPPVAQRRFNSPPPKIQNAAPAPTAESSAPEEKRRGSIQLYDKGNVTVMSGGVKLGVAKTVKKQPSISSISSNDLSQSSSDGYTSKRGVSPRYPSLPLPYGMQQTRTTSGFYRATAAAFRSTDSLSSSDATTEEEEDVKWLSAREQLEQQEKRCRNARGRRTRGRGAGRALRRQQAAALRALAAAEQQAAAVGILPSPVGQFGTAYIHHRGMQSLPSISQFSNSSHSLTSSSPSFEAFEVQLQELARQHLQADIHPFDSSSQHSVPFNHHGAVNSNASNSTSPTFPAHALPLQSVQAQQHYYPNQPFMRSTSPFYPHASQQPMQKPLFVQSQAPHSIGNEHLIPSVKAFHPQVPPHQHHRKPSASQATPRPHTVHTF